MTIVAKAFWCRLDLPGHDVCRLEQRKDGWRLDGVAVFRGEAGPASIAYRVDCDAGWKTMSAAIEGMIGVRRVDYAIARNLSGWTVNSVTVQGMQHLVDVDLGFTPATNLQQLQRVEIVRVGAVDVPVAWFDIETGKLTELAQRYERRGESTYWYEAPRFGYAGLLELDPDGFIRSYPSLWERE